MGILNRKSTTRLLKLIAKYNLHGEVLWDESMQFFVVCNDLFIPASADAVSINNSCDVDLLQWCIENTDDINGPTLYCCARVGMMPYDMEMVEEKWRDSWNELMARALSFDVEP